MLCPGWVRTSIVESEWNRPAELADEPVEASQERQAVAETMRAAVEWGISPEEAAGDPLRESERTGPAS